MGLEVGPGQVRAEIERQTTIHSHIQIYGQFRITSNPKIHVFGLWEESGEENTHKQTPHLGSEFKPIPSCFEATFQGAACFSGLSDQISDQSSLHKRALYSVHLISYTTNFKSLINRICMSLDCNRKLEQL